MTNFELISLIMAGLALLVSAVTLYLTYFHKRPKLVGLLVLQQKAGSGRYDYTLEYALCNAGNVQLLLKDVWVGSDTEVVEAKFDTVPSIIEPSQVKLVTVRLETKDAEKVRMKGEQCFVTFILVSSRGKVYDLKHDISPLEIAPNPPGNATYMTLAPDVEKPFKRLKRFK